MTEIISIKYQKQFRNAAAIAANGTLRIPIPSSDVDTHRFFNDLTIINTSSSLIRVIPDDDPDKSFLVQGGSAFNWSFSYDNMKYSSLFVEELSGVEMAIQTFQCIVMKKRIEVV